MSKTFELSELQARLLKERILDIHGKIDHDTGEYVREALLRLRTEGSPDITVRIMSVGGDTHIGLDILYDLSQYSGHKTGIIDGYCYSVAALILQACDLRIAAPSGTMILHNARAFANGIDSELIDPETRKYHPRKRIEDFERSMARSKKLQDLSDDILIRRCGMTRGFVRKLCRREESLMADEALAIGMIDKIIRLPRPKKKKRK